MTDCFIEFDYKEDMIENQIIESIYSIYTYIEIDDHTYIPAQNYLHIKYPVIKKIQNDYFHQWWVRIGNHCKKKKEKYGLCYCLLRDPYTEVECLPDNCPKW